MPAEPVGPYTAAALAAAKARDVASNLDPDPTPRAGTGGGGGGGGSKTFSKNFRQSLSSKLGVGIGIGGGGGGRGRHSSRAVSEDSESMASEDVTSRGGESSYAGTYDSGTYDSGTHDGTRTYDESATYDGTHDGTLMTETVGGETSTYSASYQPSRRGRSSGGRSSGLSPNAARMAGLDDGGTNDGSTLDGTAGGSTVDGGTRPKITRYRGFSTSISSLFLDESLVCGAVSCFGLILSQRSEHLLNVRNEARGLVSRRGGSKSAGAGGGVRQPSRMVAVALIATLVGMAGTYAFWGFGNKYEGRGSNGGGGGGISAFYDFMDDEYMSGGDDDYSNNNGGGGGDDDYAANNGYDDDGGGGGGGGGGDDDRYHNQNMYYGDDNWRNNNNNNNNQNQDDDYNANNNNNDQNDDDYGNNNNQNQNDDDYANNNNQNDDYANNNNYNQNQDDYYKNNQNYNYRYGDDNYYGNRDRSRRRLPLLGAGSSHQGRGNGGMMISSSHSSPNHHPQPTHLGICKVRDAAYYLWEPLFGLVDDTVRASAADADADQRDLQSNNGGSGGADTGTWIRLGLGLAFLAVLGLVGRRRRMRTRYELLRARAQDDHLFYSSTVAGSGSMEDELDGGREDKYEGACSHTLCGCYPVDEYDPADDEEEYEEDDDGDVKDDDTFTNIANDTKPGQKGSRKKKHRGQDCVARFFSCISTCCCGCLCKVWIQVFSICALAQEGREVRLLLPPRLQRVDILTHQPWYEYYKDIYNLRLRWMAQNRDKKRNVRGVGIMPHFRAISRLSRYILTLFAVCTVAVILVLKFNPRAIFDWGDVFVLVATFLQSFILLFFVHWIFHKSDLSFDAVIKFYGAGFIIATPTAFLAEGILINVMLFVVYIFYAIGAVIWEQAFLDWVARYYGVFWLIGEIVNAFVVAALTEELCKYYAFRFVEHPDLIFLTGLDRSRADSESLYGGDQNYAYNSHNVSSNLKGGDDFDLDQNIAAGYSQRKDTHRGKRSRAAMQMGFNRAEGDEKDEEEVRTFRQRAAAITTAMIGTAVGLTCAENFLFVFFFGGANSGGEEMAILIFRSIFPVHALAAAMQSIGVIHKFLELPGKGGRFGVGKIIFPAVLLHGTFDSILMGINVYIESAWDAYYKANDGQAPDDEAFVPYNALAVNIAVWVCICSTMVGGLIWYIAQNRSQKKRLKRLEDREDHMLMELAAMNSGDGNRKRSYVNPRVVKLGGRDDNHEFV